jgi:hypothetical protein
MECAASTKAGAATMTAPFEPGRGCRLSPDAASGVIIPQSDRSEIP